MDAVVQVAASPFEVVVGELTINLLRQKAAFRGRSLKLSSFEYRILEYFALRNGSPISSAQLEEHLLKPGAEVYSNLVATQVCRLRSKLEQAGCYYLPSIPGRSGRGYALSVQKTAG